MGTHLRVMPQPGPYRPPGLSEGGGGGFGGGGAFAYDNYRAEQRVKFDLVFRHQLSQHVLYGFQKRRYYFGNLLFYIHAHEIFINK